jgi:hypothetical protein
MWLDADDEIPPLTISKINELKKLPADRVYALRLKNIEPEEALYIGGGHYQAKMFPNDHRLEFRGRIHESITPSAIEMGLPIIPLDNVFINHYGYRDAQKNQEKIERNNRLYLISGGFEPGTKFFTFNLQGYICYYAPNVLSIWKNTKLIGCCDPFDSSYPETEDERGESLLTRAIEVIKEFEKPVEKLKYSGEYRNLCDEIDRLVKATKIV